jgi:hypothetical protein
MRLLARKDYQIGANISGAGLDDPDANFYGNFYLCTFGRMQEVWLDR